MISNQIPFLYSRSDGASCVYSQLNHDVGLLKLASPVMFNDYVNTVCLPAQSQTVNVGTKCFITGMIFLYSLIFCMYCVRRHLQFIFTSLTN